MRNVRYFSCVGCGYNCKAQERISCLKVGVARSRLLPITVHTEDLMLVGCLILSHHVRHCISL